MKLAKLAGILFGQCLGYGRQQLRHLHDRPLEAAERSCELDRIARTIPFKAEEVLAGNARRDRPDVGADPHIARRAGGKAVRFSIAEGQIGPF